MENLQKIINGLILSETLNTIMCNELIFWLRIKNPNDVKLRPYVMT